MTADLQAAAPATHCASDSPSAEQWASGVITTGPTCRKCWAPLCKMYCIHQQWFGRPSSWKQMFCFRSSICRAVMNDHRVCQHWAQMGTALGIVPDCFLLASLQQTILTSPQRLTSTFSSPSDWLPEAPPETLPPALSEPPSQLSPAAQVGDQPHSWQPHAPAHAMYFAGSWLIGSGGVDQSIAAM